MSIHERKSKRARWSLLRTGRSVTFPLIGREIRWLVLTQSNASPKRSNPNGAAGGHFGCGQMMMMMMTTTTTRTTYDDGDDYMIWSSHFFPPFKAGVYLDRGCLSNVGKCLFILLRLINGTGREVLACMEKNRMVVDCLLSIRIN